MAEVDDIDRLRHIIRERRLAMGMSVMQAAKRAGITRQTWGAVEAGARQGEALTYSKIEKALSWTAGSIRLILTGGDPQNLDMPPEERRRQAASKIETLQAIADDATLPDGTRAHARAVLLLIDTTLARIEEDRRAG